MQLRQIDEITRASAVLEYIAVSLPELERSDLISSQVAYAHYVILSGIAETLRNLGQKDIGKKS